ncbi:MULTISPECIES: hypothetical protein [unclassified Bradyrhizobium]|uniref:hypothetical protein n=1 Tax=unclassified Bradyrhizobium TaxID=2631580 RepID=UPI002916D357|nr:MULTISPECIES: hypothetical protein [unclassified Bradyrhizobium]
MRFPEGFKPPSQETIDRVNNPATFVVATWNGIPADNSGKRLVRYLTSRVAPWSEVELWNTWRSNARQFATIAEAEAAISTLKLEWLRTHAKVYPNCEAHVMTGGIAGKELT